MRFPVLVAILSCAGAPLAAQNGGDRYLPLASWTTPYVEHLARAGVLRGLDPLSRPLRRADVARAIAAVDTTAVSASVLGILHLLAPEVAPTADTVHWTVQWEAGVLAASDARRWALRPSADSTGFFPQGGLALSLEMPHLTLVTHPRIDNRLRYDPDYAGKKDRFVSGRNAEAYLAASWRYLDVFFGSTDRNWGAPDVEGLLLSPSPYSFDQLFVRLGPRRLRLEMLATELDDLPLFNSTFIARRYLTLHRLVVEPSDRLAIALSEAALYASSGGVTRSFEPWYLNPLNLFLLQQTDGAPTANSLLAGEVSWGIGSVRLFGQLYLDDFQVDRRAQSDQEPAGYGYTLAASGGAAAGRLSWSGFYTRVTNLAYRTPANEEQYTLNGVGLGRNFDDYDQATVRGWIVPAPRLLVGGELSYLRQGEGAITKPYPPVSAYNDSLAFLTGVVERTVRLGAQMAWTPRQGATLTADVGRHFIANAGHVDGASLQRWVWRLTAVVRHEFSGAVRW